MSVFHGNESGQDEALQLFNILKSLKSLPCKVFPTVVILKSDVKMDIYAWVHYSISQFSRGHFFLQFYFLDYGLDC